MSLIRKVPVALAIAYICCSSGAYAKPIEDIFSEMLSLRESDPAGFWAMVTCIVLLFTLAFSLMVATMGYYVRNWSKRK